MAGGGPALLVTESVTCVVQVNGDAKLTKRHAERLHSTGDRVEPLVASAKIGHERRNVFGFDVESGADKVRGPIVRVVGFEKEWRLVASSRDESIALPGAPVDRAKRDLAAVRREALAGTVEEPSRRRPIARVEATDHSGAFCSKLRRTRPP